MSRCLALAGGGPGRNGGSTSPSGPGSGRPVEPVAWSAAHRHQYRLLVGPSPLAPRVDPRDNPAVRRGRRVGIRTLTVAAASIVASCGTTTPSSTPTTRASTLSWTGRTVPAGVGILNSVACPASTKCYAVGGTVYGTGPGTIIGSSNGGASWQLLDTMPQTWLAAIACPTTSTCIAVGGGGESLGETTVPLLLLSTDGGQHWSQEHPPAQMGGILDVACASQTSCVVVGNKSNVDEGQTGLAHTADGGTSWTIETAPAGLAAIDSVTCPTSFLCMIGGSGPGSEASSPSIVSVSHDSGTDWSPVITAGGTSGLGQISCSDVNNCVGIIESGATDSYGTGLPTLTSNGGTIWTEGSSPIGSAVSCVQHACISVGGLYQSSTMTFPGDAYISTDNGLEWDSMSISTPQALNGITCVSSVNCVAVGGTAVGANSAYGVIFTYGS